MSAIGQPTRKHRTKSKVLKRNYARLVSLGTAITPTSWHRCMDEYKHSIIPSADRKYVTMKKNKTKPDAQ